jgi:phosphate uptake regulator
MKRKLIQLSPSTLVTSLPAAWVKKNTLAKGTEVNMQEVENALLITTDKAKTAKEITVSLRGLKEDVAFTYADSTYIAGYDEITFLIDKSQQEIMLYVAREVPGMIITSQTQNQVTFKDITANHQEDVDTIISRLHNMVLSMITDSNTAAQEKKWDALQAIKQQDYVFNSYVSYAQRLINKFGYQQFSKTGIIITYLKLLEVFADTICEYAKESAKKKQTISFEPLHACMKQAIKAHTKYNQKEIISLEKLRQDIPNHFEKSKSQMYELLELIVQMHI